MVAGRVCRQSGECLHTEYAEFAEYLHTESAEIAEYLHTESAEIAEYLQAESADSLHTESAEFADYLETIDTHSSPIFSSMQLVLIDNLLEESDCEKAVLSILKNFP